MIALISGAVLALFLAGVDARAIRFKTLEVRPNDGVFPSSAQMQNPSQGTGTAASVVLPTGTESRPEPSPEGVQKRIVSPAFKTLTVAMFDGIFPSPHTQWPGSGIVIDPSYPTGHIFPVATGSQLEPSASATSSPLPSSDAPPGFFVSLPYYTVTITQTVTYAGMTKTSLHPSLTTNSTLIPDSSSMATLSTTPTASPTEASALLGGNGPNHETVLGNSQVPSEVPKPASPAVQTFEPGMESALGIAPLNVAPTQIPTSILSSMQTPAPSIDGPGAIPPIPQSSGVLPPSLLPYSNSTVKPPLAQSTTIGGNPTVNSVLPIPIETPIVTTIDTAVASTFTSSYTIPVSTITIGEGVVPAAATPAATAPVAAPGTNQAGSIPAEGSQTGATQPEIVSSGSVQPGIIQPVPEQSTTSQTATPQLDVISPEIIYPEVIEHGASPAKAVPPEYAHRAYAYPKAANIAITHPKTSPPEVTHAEITHARLAQVGGSRPGVAHAGAAPVGAMHAKVPQGDYARVKVTQGGLVW